MAPVIIADVVNIDDTSILKIVLITKIAPNIYIKRSIKLSINGWGFLFE